MREEIAEVSYSIGDRLLDKLDELRESNKEVAEKIEKLLYYVIVIGALNGTVTVGKIVDSVVDTSKTESIVVKENSPSEHKRAFDSREDQSSKSKPVN